jgi:hypothetical protein
LIVLIFIGIPFGLEIFKIIFFEISLVFGVAQSAFLVIKIVSKYFGKLNETLKLLSVELNLLAITLDSVRKSCDLIFMLNGIGLKVVYLDFFFS